MVEVLIEICVCRFKELPISNALSSVEETRDATGGASVQIGLAHVASATRLSQQCC